MPLPDVVFFYVNTLNAVHTCSLNSFAIFISDGGCKCATANGVTFINHQSHCFRRIFHLYQAVCLIQAEWYKVKG